MPIITAREDYNGFVNRVDRLGLSEIVEEAEGSLSAFTLEIKEDRHANGTRDLRAWIDEGFEAAGGWVKTAVGGIDWEKANDGNARLGVEVQVSARSDLLAVDLLHLRDSMQGGLVEVGIIMVPDDSLSYYLTDRTPNLRTAIKHVEAQATDLPIRIVAFSHDRTGDALRKMRTNLGKGSAP